MAILAPVDQKQREPNVTTFQKAQLVKLMQKLDHEMRTRHYPAVLASDAAEAEHDVEQFKRECERDRRVRHYAPVLEAERYEEEARAMGGRSYEEYCEAEQGYQDRK